MSGYISKKARIGRNCVIDPDARIYGPTTIGDNSIIEPNVTIGYPYFHRDTEEMRRLVNKGITDYNEIIERMSRGSRIGNDVRIGTGSIICQGAEIGDGTYIDFGCFVGEGTKIGEGCTLSYRAQIYNDVKIGKKSWITGFVCDNTKIGRNTVFMGKTVHKYNFPPERRPVFDEIEPAPIIGNYVFVGMGAIIIGDVEIGDYATVGAGAVVTKDVEPGETVAGVPAKPLRK